MGNGSERAKARRFDVPMPENEPDDRRDDSTSRENAEAARTPRVRFIGEKYRLLFERNPLPMWVFDVKSLYFLAVNDAAVAHYGYSRNEFLRMTIKDIRPAADIAGLDEELNRLDSATESIGIWRQIRRDGSIIDVEVRGNEIDFDGHRARLILALDITERLRSERRLRTEYAVTKALAESTTVAAAVPRILRAVCEEASWEYGELWRVSSEGTTLGWQGAWHIPDFPARELEEASRTIVVRRGVGIPGTTWATGRPEFLEELTPASHFNRVQPASRLGLRQGLSFPLTGRGGDVLGVMVFFSRTPREPELSFLDLMADLGERVGQFLEAGGVEAERGRLAERFSMAFYRSPLPGIISRLDGSRILEVNESFLQTFGYRREELVGRTSEEVNILQPLESRAAILEPLTRGLPVRGAETVLRTKNGELRRGRLWSERLGLASEPTILTIIEDVTDLRAAEARLIESERLASVGRTAAFVAHELNTPLTNIALLTASIRRQTPDGATRERADRIDEQRRLATRIIEEVLTFTRSSVLNRRETDLASLVRAAVDQAGSYRKSGVDVRLELGEAPVPARVDILKLSQAVVNLVKNAFQATDGGTVRVSLRQADGTVDVEVQDTGPGIPEADRAKLFEPFYTTKPRGEGMGLGLTFVKAVAEAHGGRVDVATELGKGSTFTLRVPLEVPAA